jgi:DDE superfamily endonuclease
MDIITLLTVLSQSLDATSIRQLSIIATAMLTMSGRVTMVGIARWSEQGGSYRTVQRFYNRVIPWGMVLWLFFEAYLYQEKTEYLLVGDESVVSKAGKASHGLDRFFSSIFGKPIAGLAFFTLALVNVEERKSYPLLVEQVVRSEAEKAASKAKKEKATKQQSKGSQKPGKAGRPKGVTNQNKREIEWTEEMLRLKRMGGELLERIKCRVRIRYIVLDGHFGNNNVAQVVRQSLDLHLICKLRNDSALFFPIRVSKSAREPVESMAASSISTTSLLTIGSRLLQKRASKPIFIRPRSCTKLLPIASTLCSSSKPISRLNARRMSFSSVPIWRLPLTN